MSPSFKSPVPPGSTVPRVLLTNELVTGPPGKEMLHRAGDLLPSKASVTVLDNACGAGTITALLQEQAQERGMSDRLSIIAADKAPAMVATMNTRTQESNWSNVKVLQFDHADMPLPDSSVDHAFTNFGIFFGPGDGAALQQVRRVLKKGGTAGFTSWKSIAWWPMAQQALRTQLPDAPPLQDVQVMFTPGWDNVEGARKKLEDAGFSDAQVEEFAFAPMVGPDEFGEATAELVKMATMRMWDENARKEFGSGIQDAVVKYLKETYTDGVWDGKMTAVISLGKA